MVSGDEDDEVGERFSSVFSLSSFYMNRVMGKRKRGGFPLGFWFFCY